MGASDDIISNVLVTKNLGDSIDDVTDSVHEFAKAGKGLDGVALAFGNIGTKLKGLIFNPATLGITALIAALTAAYLYLNRFNNAIEKSEKSLSVYKDSAAELENLKKEADGVRSSLEEIGGHYDIEFSGSETVDEMIGKIESIDTITLTDQADLENLKLQNAELERQIQLQDTIVQKDQEQARENAMTALTMKATSNLTKQKENTNSLAQGILLGNGATAAYEYGSYEQTDIRTATKDEIAQLEKLNEEKISLNKQYNKATTESSKKALQQQIQNNEDEAKNLRDNISKNIESLNSLKDAFKDSTNVEDQLIYKDINSIIDSWNNIDLNSYERDLKKLDTFFSTTAGTKLKAELMESSDSAGKLREALKSLGLSLDDIGIDNIDTLQKYLNDSTAAANETAEAIRNITTVSDVKKAFDSENQGINYDSMVENLTKANELYKQGLIGTDDFQITAQWIVPDDIPDDSFGAQAYKEAWEKAYNQVKGWFNADTPAKGMWTFLDDLYAKNNALYTTYDKVNGVVEFNAEQFKNSAQAAKILGVNVDVVDTMLHKLQEFGFEFDENFVFSGEGLSAYESSLSGIKDIYKNLADGEVKDNLGKMIQNWDEELNYFSNNLEELTDDQVIKIKFEYELATIQQKIDELNQQIVNGDDSIANLAARARYQEEYLKKREEKTQVTDYGSSNDAVSTLSSQIATTSDEALKKSLIKQKSAVLEMQTLFQDMFSSGAVTDWDSFLNTDKANNLFEQLVEQGYATKHQLETLLGIDFTDKLFKNGKKELPIKITADVDDVEKEITQFQHQDGTYSYTAIIDDVETEVYRIKNQNGEIVYTANLEKVKQALEEAGTGGNVDLTKRPIVNGSSMIQAGYNDFNEDDFATVYSHTFSNEEGTVAINFTPILPDGTVLKKGEFEQYCQEVVDGVHVDDKGLQIGSPFNGENAIAEAEQQAQYIHDLHAKYFENDIFEAKVKTVLDPDGTKEASGELDEFIKWNSKQEIPLTVDSNIEDFEDAWEKFEKEKELKVKAEDEVTPVIDNINKQELYDKTVTLYGEDEATGVINLWNILEASPKFSKLSAEDQATLVIEYWNQLEPEDKNAIISSQITAQDGASDIIADVNVKIDSMNLNPSVSLDAVDNITPVVNTAKTALDNLDGKVVNTYIITHKQTKGDSDLAGTAHHNGGKILSNKAFYSGTVGGMYPIPQLSGRALALGNLQDSSWLKPEWKTQRDNVALTGELGREIVVNGNRWWTVGDNGAEFASIPKGSIVFNAKQSKELLEKGFTNSRGVARAKGTAFSLGGILPTPGNNYTYTGTGSKKNNNNNNNNNNGNNGGSNNDAEEAFEDVRDWVEKYLKYHARLTEKLTKAIENAVGLTEKQVATNKAIAQVQAEIAANEKALATYKSKADSIGLDSNYKNQVINGSLNIETITDETLRDTIADFEEWHDKILDCEDTIDDLKDSLKDLAQQKFDNVTTEFENQISLIEHEIELINLSIDQMEERGYLVSSKFYEQMIQNETENLNKLKAEYDNLNSTLKDLMDQGLVTKYSDQWYEMTQSINDVSEAIVESNTALIEYQNSIRDLKWDAFDKLQEKVSGITDETDFLIKLMSNEKMFETDTGAITQQGKSVLGMNAVKYNTLMAQADEYAKEIAEIEKQLETDPYNLKLTERYNELLEEQRDTILEAQDAFESAIDVVKDGFDAFLNAMDKAIDKRTEELNAAKDLYDYEKQINEQTKEISQLQKQLASFQGDNSEEAKATIQQIKVNLEEAKMNLDETEYDKYISDQEQLLNDLRDETEEWINQRMDDRDWLLQQVIDYTNANADDIGNTIREQADSVGYTISDAINSIWSPNGTYTQVVAGYVKDFTSLFTTTNNALADIKRYMAKMVGESDTKAEEQMKEASNPTKAPETPKPETPKQPQQPATPTGDGVPKVGDEAIYATGNYYYSSDGESPLGNQNRGGRVYITKVNSASWATKPYHISTGNTFGNGDLGWVSLDQLIGYSKGGLVTDTGLAMLHGSKSEPELVLNSQDTKNFIDLKDSLSKVRMKASNGLAVDTTNPFSNLVASNQTMNYLKNLHVLPEGAVVVNDNKQVDVSIGDIQMYGVNDPEQFASQLIEIMQSNKRIEKIVQEMTLGAMLGRNSMSKYRY